MSTQHTPGPWSIERGRSGVIVAIGPCAPDEYAGAAWLEISEADANVMAAAIDLYAIAQAALTACERVNGVASGVDFCALAVGLRAAIAKAEGQS